MSSCTGCLPWVIRWWPLGIPVGIALLDRVAAVRSWPVPIAGLLDEPAHLGTSWLALLALAPRPAPRWLCPAALAASVAIDVDHIPLYLTGGFVVDGGRPPTHSLSLVLALALVSLLPRSRWILGAAAGVILHLVRDVATGPGVALLWPASDITVRWPHTSYLGGLAVLAVIASLRQCPDARRRQQQDLTRSLRRRRRQSQPTEEQSDPAR